MAIPRRTVNELAAIHRREPSCHDVIVEGTCDRCLIEWFLSESGVAGASVYEIGSFEIDPQQLTAYGLQDNNRGRVITLAYEFEKIFGHVARLTCIADSDFDIVLGKLEECSLLLLTDYTCMEMYALNLKTLGKYLRLNLRNFPKDAKRVITEIADALQKLFVFRLVNFVLSLGLRAVDFEPSLSLSNVRVELNCDNYLSRYLNKNRRMKDKTRFEEEYGIRLNQLGPELRNQIQGHDFMELLSWYIRQHRGFAKQRDADALQREVFMCFEISQLQREKLFQRILERVGE
jgi:hypothetical protein